MSTVILPVHWNYLWHLIFLQAILFNHIVKVNGENLTANGLHPTSPLSALIEGYIMLGGLFPVHQKGERDIPCGKINVDRGIQRIEAMLYTIDRINRDESILPNIKLGANIFDTCARGTYALEQSLAYIRSSFSSLDSSEFLCEDGSKARTKNEPKTVAGVIGGSYSSVSIQVANLLRLFKIPQISYASTSSQLSDKTRYEYFMRTVPPDRLQALAMIDIVQHFNWTYISTVASEGAYGVSGIEYFQREARARNICLAETLRISGNPTQREYEEIIDVLSSKINAKVVILYVLERDALGLLNAATWKSKQGQFTWVAASGWGTRTTPVKHNSLAADGALTTVIQSNPIPEFDDYFMNLKPHNNSRNPWFREYWEFVHNCKWPSTQNSITEQGPFCRGDEELSRSKYRQESKIQFIYDAVLAIAYSIDKLRQDLCTGETKPCGLLKNINGDLLKKYIFNMSFDNGYGTHVQFDENGDVFGRYSIMNFQVNKANGNFEYKKVGSWVSSLSLNVSDIVWAGGTKDIPISRCSQPCNFDEKKYVGEDGDTCCWVCIKCRDFEYLKDEYTCKDCGPGRWPYSHRTDCYNLEEQYMKFDTVYSIVPLSLSGVGILTTLFVMFAFMKYNDTPVVRASGRELSFLLLYGCLICYLITVVLILKPTPTICALHRFGVGFGFAIMYSSLLTKTNRISRIFDSARNSARRPPFISPKTQMVISLILVSLQAVFTAIWLVLEPPGIRIHYPNGRRDRVILKCLTNDQSFLVSLIYNAILIIVCTFYAVRTRKIPENFNESKFIGFAMYTTCIIWLAFVPVYFGTLNSFEIQIATLCVSISLSASVALVCLFAPKMYIIFFHPEKNVRKLHLKMNSMNRKREKNGDIEEVTTDSNIIHTADANYSEDTDGVTPSDSRNRRD